MFHFFIGLNFAYVKNRKVLKKREIRNQNIKKNLSCENVQNEKKTLKICTTNNAKKKIVKNILNSKKNFLPLCLCYHLGQKPIR